MKHQNLKRYGALTLSFMTVLATATIGLQALPALAGGPLTSLTDVMSDLTDGAVSNHQIKFVSPTGVAAGQTITYTFASGFNMGSVAFGDIDFASGSTNNCSSASFTEKTLAGTASGTTWGAAVTTSPNVITITSGTDTIAADKCIRLKVGTNASGGTNQITNPSSANSYTITMAGSFTDTGTITITTVANGVVAVSATVNQSISFTVTQNSIGFGTLSTSQARYATTGGGSNTDSAAAHNLTAGTNSSSGYTVTVQGATLTSGGNTITAITGSPDTSHTNSAQFGIYLDKTGGTNSSLATNYATASSFFYGANATTSDTIASATGVDTTTTYGVHYLANIAASTAAGSYSASLTYVATGNF